MPDARDIFLTARRVHGGSGSPPDADAVLVRGGMIDAVGTRSDLATRAHGVRHVALDGATLTAGFVDAHVHLTEWALTRQHVDLGGSRSPEDAAARLSAATAGDGWIRGRGWSSHDWGGRIPERFVVDAVTGQRPALLQSHDMHSLWLNTAALHQAGITAATADPDGGRIVRDESGEPTGLLLETAAQLALAALPKPTIEETKRAVIDGQRELHRLGFTGVHSFPGIHIPDPDPFTVLQSLWEDGSLRLRILQHVAVEKLDALIDVGIRSGFGNEWLRIGAVKMFLDGALGSRTAWMKRPYEGSDNTGVRVMDPALFAKIVERATTAGLAVTVHAIGDAAVELAVRELSPASRRIAAMPHRIEHVQCCPPELFNVIGKAGIISSVQPCHLMSDWRAADEVWGDRAAHTYAFRSLLDGGTVLAFGSDAPVEPIDPRRGLQAAICRTDDELLPEGGWYDEQCLTPLEALEGFTLGPALAAGTEDVHGTLRPGARADITAWSGDPLDIRRHARDLACVATVVAGEIVFQH